MIDLLLRAVDRVIDLAKIKEKRIKVRYEEIYKPSFVELQSVHTDYVNILTELDSKLRKLRPEIAANDPEVIDALEFIRVRRTALWPIREKLWIFQHFIEGKEGENLPPAERAFLQSVVDYFDTGGISAPRTSISSSIVDKLEMAIRCRVDREMGESASIPSVEDVQRDCREAIALLQTSWAVSVQRFNELRLRYTQGST